MQWLPRSRYVTGKQTFGRALLASLEVFVAADLIRTVSVDLTLEGVGALGLLVGHPHHPQLLDRHRDHRHRPVACPRDREQRQLMSAAVLRVGQEYIDCDACVEACPVDACFAEEQLPAEWNGYTALNASYFAAK